MNESGKQPCLAPRKMYKRKFSEKKKKKILHWKPDLKLIQKELQRWFTINKYKFLSKLFTGQWFKKKNNNFHHFVGSKINYLHYNPFFLVDDFSENKRIITNYIYLV